jgi:hypothetical protein
LPEPPPWIPQPPTPTGDLKTPPPVCPTVYDGYVQHCTPEGLWDVHVIIKICPDGSWIVETTLVYDWDVPENMARECEFLVPTWQDLDADILDEFLSGELPMSGYK